MQPLPAPELVRYYHHWMDGVDVHDQLRMQHYSVQLSYKTHKYYKTLFLRLLDMTLVNAFIVFRHNRKVNNKRPPLTDLQQVVTDSISHAVFTSR